MAASESGRLQDDFIAALLSLPHESSRTVGDEDFSQTLTDLYRMTFMDNQIVSGGRWETPDETCPMGPSSGRAVNKPITNTAVRALYQPYDYNTAGMLQGRGREEEEGVNDGLRVPSDAKYSGLPSLPDRDSGHLPHRRPYPVGMDRPLDVTERQNAAGQSISASQSLSTAYDLADLGLLADAETPSFISGEFHEIPFSLDVPLSDEDYSAVFSEIRIQGNGFNDLLSNDDAMDEFSFTTGPPHQGNNNNNLSLQTDCKQLLNQVDLPGMMDSRRTAAPPTSFNELDDELFLSLFKDDFLSEGTKRMAADNSSARNDHVSDTFAAREPRKIVKACRKIKDRRADLRPSAPPPPPTTSLPVVADSQVVHKAANQAKASQYALKCLTKFGICVVDNYMGTKAGSGILQEVQSLELMGLFEDGQLITQADDTKAIRGDKIMWVEREDEKRVHISSLIRRLDGLITSLNGLVGHCEIKSRSKAMVACYPGHGRGYMRHVDNATQDGRCITSIYYLNKDWNSSTNGGLLRMFPQQFGTPVEVEPKFDRLLLFWSDNRNPHEVLPAYRDRYAITVWYFDDNERQLARLRYLEQGLAENSSNFGDSRLRPISMMFS